MFLFYGCYFQIEQQKNKILCRGKLNHLGTMFFLYRSSFSKENVADWPKNISFYANNSELDYCPATQKNSHSYKLNLDTFSQLDMFSKEKVPVKILFFDSNDTENSLSKNLDDISWRHLEGANLLLENGSVIYSKKQNLQHVLKK